MIVFDDMIADALCNKYLNPMVTELFIRGGKLNISLVFIMQFYFSLANIYQTEFHTLFYYFIEYSNDTDDIYKNI